MAEQTPNDRARAWTINWSNIVSFRVLFGAFVIALVVAILPSMISSAFGGVVFVIVFLVVYGNAIFNPEAPVLYCPHCRKRVKAGATTCHHCGKAVA